MDFSNLKSLTIPEGEVAEITCDGVTLWKAGYTNLVPLSTEEDGKTIYNGGLGYKDGYRVRSSGAEQATTNTSCIGFMPVKGGDVVRMSGWDFSYVSNSNAINVADKDFTNIGQFTMLKASYGIFLESAYSPYTYTSVVQEKDGVWKWIVPPTASGVAYIRITGYTHNKGNEMIVTVNEEII